jgi:hypothetical protein
VKKQNNIPSKNINFQKVLISLLKTKMQNYPKTLETTTFEQRFILVFDGLISVEEIYHKAHVMIPTYNLALQCFPLHFLNLFLA